MKLIKLLCVLFCCLLLASCAAGPSADIKKSADAGVSATETEGYQMLLLSTGVGFGADAGYYELLDRAQHASNIIFTDYATAEQHYVCNKILCKHNDADCPSYVNYNAVYGNVFV